MNQVADPQMLLTLKTVQKQLIRLLAHFPGNGRTVEGLAIIAPDYLEAFKGYYDSEFIDLISIAINEQGRRFFPTIGDLKKIEVSQKSYTPYGGSGSLPYVEDMPIIQELTEADRILRKEKIKDLTKNIGEEMPGEGD